MSKIAEVARVTGTGNPLELIGLEGPKRQHRRVVCSNCGQEKSLSGFNKIGRDVYNHVCRSCEVRTVEEPGGIEGICRLLGREIEGCGDDGAKAFLRSALENVMMANVKIQIAKV